MSLKTSAVHVRVTPFSRHQLRAASGLQQSFRCHRCARDLPEGQFVPVGSNPKRGIIYLHPICTTCRKQMRSLLVEHPLYTAELHRFVTSLCSGAKSGAASRGLVWALTADDVLGMYFRQNGLCALSSFQMTYRKAATIGKDWTAISIDRVNSERNYTLDNVHLVCAAVNIMKMDLPLSDFVRWCARISATAMRDTDPAA